MIFKKTESSKTISFITTNLLYIGCIKNTINEKLGYYNYSKTSKRKGEIHEGFDSGGRRSRLNSS